MNLSRSSGNIIKLPFVNIVKKLISVNIKICSLIEREMGSGNGV